MEGLPSFYAVNTPMPPWATQFCGLVTWGLRFAVARLVGTDSHARVALHAPLQHLMETGVANG